MDMEPVTELNEMGRATLTELANMITGQAVTKLHNLGFKFDLTPPAIITGENMSDLTSSNVRGTDCADGAADGQDRDQCG
jgi:CheY-specific phosphatase CheX